MDDLYPLHRSTPPWSGPFVPMYLGKKPAPSRKDPEVGGQPMEFVGSTAIESFQNATSAFFGSRHHRRVVRRTDYPASTTRPPQAASFDEILRRSYSEHIVWTCNGYQKRKIATSVWIEPPPPPLMAGGHGNAARRRLGWTARWICQPPHEDDHGYVWFDAQGQHAGSPPWEPA